MTFRFAVDRGAEAALAGFDLPRELGFAQVHAPVMFEAEYGPAGWRQGRLLPFGPIAILPNARSLQFGESVFEGMKAYRVPGAAPHLFRPDRHWRRMVASAARIGIPAIPHELFTGGIAAVVSACADIIPTDESASLYLRPFVYACDAGYSVGNSANYRFMVLASPSGPYASGDLRAMIERDEVRAARGGTGAAKTPGNYAAAMRATSAAAREGFSIALWLDPIRRETVEEFSAMNLFAVIDGALHTPALSDSILAGVTRDSIIALARHGGQRVVEREIPIGELLAAIADGRCTEVFATGTAAIVAPVAEIGDADGRRYALRGGSVARELRAGILAIQNRTAADPFGWTAELPVIQPETEVEAA